MKKKSSLPKCAAPLPISVDFKALEERVFKKDEKTGVISIGGKPLTVEMSGLYKDQAANLLTTQLWEVIEATVVSEAFSLSLKSSLNWEHVQFAKALDYWHTIVSKTLVTLAKQ